MDIATLHQALDDPAAAAAWLRSLNVRDTKRGHANLVHMATGRLTLDLMLSTCNQLDEHLGHCADPDMALNNLDRFVAAARNPLAVGTLFQRDPEALSTLLQICATSQHLSDLLVADPESFDLLRATGGQPCRRQDLVDDLVSEVALLDHEEAVIRALRRFKRREILRLAYGDIVQKHSLPTVTAQISYLADAVVEAALAAAWRSVSEKRGCPREPDGEPARFVVLGMGKLGGVELNYSSDIDLLFLFSEQGQTDARRPITNVEFFNRLGREIFRLLTEPTDLGVAYRVDLRLRPEGGRAGMAMSVPAAMEYYDFRGRTWERQAFIKARPVAGDLELGTEFLKRLGPWIYRRYLSLADISGIQALKRRIEHKAKKEGTGVRNVKTGPGGIRDVEFAIQFLQLLNGGDLPPVRTTNTLEAVAQLAEAGCLTNLERVLLAGNYAFLRDIEHRLQIMFDLQTHLLPDDPREIQKLALRMGYTDSPNEMARTRFWSEYLKRTAENGRMLDFLLHEAFSNDTNTAAEVDLVLDPSPGEERISEVLEKYPFSDVRQAYRHLMALSEERIRFLSTRRCRHFLAAISPQLLKAIAATPDPDSTLVNLDRVSDSLGGKGVLWELFSFNPPSLELCVKLCAYSSHLCGILTSAPGMIDGLMDSLVLDKLPTPRFLRRTLGELCQKAEDLDPILHSFKNDQQLRVGVRDLLGKEDPSATTGALSDIAQTCLEQITRRELEQLATKFGWPSSPLLTSEPSSSDSPSDPLPDRSASSSPSPDSATRQEGDPLAQPTEFAVVAMGKFGGQEMNYQSDLDVVFLYRASESAVSARRSNQGQTGSAQHFYSELAQRIVKTTSRLGPHGRLYEVDARLRPSGKSGALATSVDEFTRYFAERQGQLWERQALCKARVVVGSARTTQTVLAAIGKAAFDRPWSRRDADEIRRMRHRLEATVKGGNVKRGAGGMVDVEFLVQMLQLKHGRRSPQVCMPNTLLSLGALHNAGYLEADDFRFFTRSYRFLRTLEGRLRLMRSTARAELPDDPTELAKLAHLLDAASREALLAEFEKYTHETRARFDRIFDAEGTY